jgi:hypothetical protein
LNRSWPFLNDLRLPSRDSEDVGHPLLAVEDALASELYSFCISPSVVIDVAGIIATKEGGASLDDFPDLIASLPDCAEEFPQTSIVSSVTYVRLMRPLPTQSLFVCS